MYILQVLFVQQSIRSCKMKKKMQNVLQDQDFVLQD